MIRLGRHRHSSAAPIVSSASITRAHVGGRRLLDTMARLLSSGRRKHHDIGRIICATPRHFEREPCAAWCLAPHSPPCQVQIIAAFRIAHRVARIEPAAHCQVSLLSPAPGYRPRGLSRRCFVSARRSIRPLAFLIAKSTPKSWHKMLK